MFREHKSAKYKKFGWRYHKLKLSSTSLNLKSWGLKFIQLMIPGQYGQACNRSSLTRKGCVSPWVSKSGHHVMNPDNSSAVIDLNIKCSSQGNGMDLNIQFLKPGQWHWFNSSEVPNMGVRYIIQCNMYLWNVLDC